MRFLRSALPAVMIVLLVSCASEPVANFDFEPTSNYAPAEVTFTNRSTDASNFRWDFGDGSNSAEKNPVHTFTSPGAFEVTLVAKGSGGENTITKSIFIDQRTTYFLRNQLSYSIYNVYSYYLDGENYDEIIEHGQLRANEESEEVQTQYTSKIYVEFEKADGTTWLTPSWFLTENARNAINLSESVIEQATTYIITNQFSQTIYDVISFYWDGESFLEEFDIGNLSPGEKSSELFTDYLEVDIYLENASGTAFLSTYPWILTEHTRNNIFLSEDSYFTEVTSMESLRTADPESLQKLREEGRSYKLREIAR